MFRWLHIFGESLIDVYRDLGFLEEEKASFIVISSGFVCPFNLAYVLTQKTG